MIRITQCKVRISGQDLKKKAAEILKVPVQEIIELHIVKQSIDARKKPDLFYVYTLDCKLKNVKEENLVKKLKNKDVCVVDEFIYQFPKVTKKGQRPIIIGTGPAGLFCGYMLAKAGLKPILLERGSKVEERKRDVEEFWKTGVLNPNSNVQFGEGGAGTFSDGKLNTLVKDKYGRNRKVLEIFVEHGANENILYDYKAHIGTDVLMNVIRSMRDTMIQNGADFYFNTRVDKLILTEQKVTGVVTSDNKEWYSDFIVLAVGHSARDTFEMLHKSSIPMEPKDFAVGFRVMHPQKLINLSQYGEDNPVLGAAPYKLTGEKLGDRNAYSFCMCPGGYVVNASSEEKRLAINGMSYSDRAGSNANSAIVVMVKKEDYINHMDNDSPLCGVYFQQSLEQKAYEMGKGKIPVETYGEFVRGIGQETANVTNEDTDYLFDDFKPAIKGEFVEHCPLHELLNDDMNHTFYRAMEQFGTKIKGFNHPKTYLAGIESRTSSPVRIIRNDECLSTFNGLYPCGEGAGYAGGITSAAMDGIKVAEQIVHHMDFL
ncbi:MAG: FAD-dependent oxidoreductase [Lachnospiraceae bacterium]|nr:FAD-dependent oxidoreductase [Lachnospiraceae bacterium]